MIYKTLEFREPEALTDVHAGTFTYVDKEGQDTTAEFFVRCCVLNPDDSATADARVDALNEQFTDQWMQLETQGCTGIKYAEVKPNPFF